VAEGREESLSKRLSTLSKLKRSRWSQRVLVSSNIWRQTLSRARECAAGIMYLGLPSLNLVPNVTRVDKNRKSYTLSRTFGGSCKSRQSGCGIYSCHSCPPCFPIFTETWVAGVCNLQEPELGQSEENRGQTTSAILEEIFWSKDK
jgi:hypothetical protein